MQLPAAVYVSLSLYLSLSPSMCGKQRHAATAREQTTLWQGGRTAKFNRRQRSQLGANFANDKTQKSEN